MEARLRARRDDLSGRAGRASRRHGRITQARRGRAVIGAGCARASVDAHRLTARKRSAFDGPAPHAPVPRRSAGTFRPDARRGLPAGALSARHRIFAAVRPRPLPRHCARGRRDRRGGLTRKAIIDQHRLRGLLFLHISPLRATCSLDAVWAWLLLRARGVTLFAWAQIRPSRAAENAGLAHRAGAPKFAATRLQLLTVAC